jgi:hypothetical protein
MIIVCLKIKKYVLSICIILLSLVVSSAIIKADDSSKDYQSIEPKVRWAVDDETNTLTIEQQENILEIYSDYEDNSSVQVALLIVDSADALSGNQFLINYSGWLEKRLVIRIVKSNKKVGFFWTSALNGPLKELSEKYSTKFETYLSEGDFYEAVVRGSLELIEELSPK